MKKREVEIERRVKLNYERNMQRLKEKLESEK